MVNKDFRFVSKRSSIDITEDDRLFNQRRARVLKTLERNKVLMILTRTTTRKKRCLQHSQNRRDQKSADDEELIVRLDNEVPPGTAVQGVKSPHEQSTCIGEQEDGIRLLVLPLVSVYLNIS